MPYLLDHPRYLAMQMQEILHISVPEYIQPILEEGVADGSLQVSDIQAVGEAIMVLMGIWLQPISRPTTPEECGPAVWCLIKSPRAAAGDPAGGRFDRLFRGGQRGI